MFKRVFKWDEDDRGIEGWIMKDMPHFDAGTGLTVAHDVLEHLDRGTDLEDEMQAFGAMIYGRVEGYYWEAFTRNIQSRAETLARDMVEFLFRYNIATLQDRVTRPIDNEEHDTEAFLTNLYNVSIDSAISEWSDGHDTEITAGDIDAMHETMRRAISWMRVGYRRAQRRWKFSNREAFASMFHDLELNVDSITKQGGEFGEFQTNDELHISVSRRFDFVVKVKPYRDPYA